ncbi:MAG TPA: ABC transporter ATP-binding protein [Chloroflexota bacterium]|nr:ABC transporter ATP-binding protein [Chloroflexota bacterium]
MANDTGAYVSPTEAMIWTRGLGKRYGSFQALEGLNLGVARGEVYGFLGLNGAGKSTTIRLLCGLLRPTEGHIRIGGEPLMWPDKRQVRRRIGYLPQSVRFQEAMNAAYLIHFYARLSGVDGAEAVRKAAEMEIPMNRKLGLMSPGQQRKLGLLLATLGDPELLFLDEPTAGLDPEGQAEVRRIIAHWQQQGMTVFVSSHILGEIQQICTSVGILHQGRLLRSGPLEEAYEIEVSDFSPERWQASPHPLRLLPGGNGTQRLLARVPKRRVPDIVSWLVESDVSVYGIKEQSLESMFSLVVGGEEVG